MTSLSPLTISLIIVTLMMCPAWLQHLFAKNRGLDMMLNMSEEEVQALPPVAFHLASVIGICALMVCGLAIAASHVGDDRVKKTVTTLFCSWPIFLMWTLYSSPPAGSPPESFLAMPTPLLILLGTIPAVGYAMESTASKSKTN